MQSKNIVYSVLVLVCLSFTVAEAAPSHPFTSVADEGGIEAFCKEKLRSDVNLTYFRPMPLVDTFGPSLGWEFVSYISNHYPKLMDSLDLFRKGDSFGNSPVHDFDALGSFSPNALRYIKIAGDLDLLFGNLDDKTIVEIGGGYGGQCHVLSCLFSFKEYILIDLPEVIEFQKRYLEILGVKNVRFIAHNQLPSELPCDLLISNYAFSECSYKMQMEYIEKVLKHARTGYMISNNMGALDEKSFNAVFRKYAPNLRFVTEDPQTFCSNYIIMWNK